MNAMPKTIETSPIKPTTPVLNNSLSVSTSLIVRVIRRPTALRSK